VKNHRIPAAEKLKRIDSGKPVVRDKVLTEKSFTNKNVKLFFMSQALMLPENVLSA